MIVLSHESNKGKGAALKTGFSQCVNEKSLLGVITADADGQHSIIDLKKILNRFNENHENIILGTRTFSSSIPFRSRLGNIITKLIFKIIFKTKINDTQTGLRALPIIFCKDILKIPSNGYEFEMDMLIKAVKLNYEILEEPIKTIYIENNKSSHFNPLIDSMKIYFSLFRFSLSSLATYMVDYSVFLICHHFTKDIGVSTALARCFAFPLYLFLNYDIVFRVRPFKFIMVVKLIITIVVTGYISYNMQTLLGELSVNNVSLNKIIVESFLFFLSYFILRDIIFTKQYVGKKFS